MLFIKSLTTQCGYFSLICLTEQIQNFLWFSLCEPLALCVDTRPIQSVLVLGFCFVYISVYFVTYRFDKNCLEKLIEIDWMCFNLTIISDDNISFSFFSFIVNSIIFQTSDISDWRGELLRSIGFVFAKERETLLAELRSHVLSHPNVDLTEIQKLEQKIRNQASLSFPSKLFHFGPR